MTPELKDLLRTVIDFAAQSRKEYKSTSEWTSTENHSCQTIRVPTALLNRIKEIDEELMQAETPAPVLLGRTTEDLFMCEYIGEATDPDTGNKYELCSVLGSRALAVRSLQGRKRKTFLFDLSKLVDYAVEHGKIDEE